ncbi:DNA mismatch repair protein MutL [Pilatotrama ljubarskyi]|nr:DNA mismatch repair protein MutL [Pilatotrama ljubarskyi]
MDGGGSIRALDRGSVHSITAGQVVVDLQTAVKELVENSLDAAATNIEVRFKDYGLDSFEVIDNGSGIPPADYDHIALKHHTSKLSSFSDLEAVTTFGFRGEALSSLCTLADSVQVTTATAAEAPVGTVIQFDRSGKVKSRNGKAARQRGTTVTVSGLFKPLPVRRKELERNAKREFAKALSLLHAYALVPCASENKGVRLTVTNHVPPGKKTVQLRTDGTPSTRASVSAIWGPRTLEHLVDLDLSFHVEVEPAVLRRLGKAPDEGNANEVKVRGLISKFAVGCGRTGTDRQFFFVNGRPCAPSKVQKAFNEVYRSFNATQSPFVVADFILPSNSCDINVSPDKRTILLHSENNLVQALKTALEETYAPARSTFDVHNTATQSSRKAEAVASTASHPRAASPVKGAAEKEADPLFLPDDAPDDSVQGSLHASQDVEVLQAEQLSTVSDSHPEDEISFGEPTLLSEPALSSSAPHSSQNHAEKEGPVGVDEALGGDTRGSEDENDEPPAREGRHCAVLRLSRAPSANSKTKPAPQSPTITQMISKAPPRSRSRSSPTTDKDADLPHIPTEPSHDNPSLYVAHTASTHHKPDEPEAETPIPSIKPPPRPTTRTSASSHPASQMVLSTAGASWNLRRAADAPTDNERPRKRGRVDVLQETGDAGKGKEARKGMRELLRGFARKGSIVEDVPPVDGDGDDEESEGVGGEVVVRADEDELMEDDESERGVTVVVDEESSVDAAQRSPARELESSAEERMDEETESPSVVAEVVDLTEDAAEADEPMEDVQDVAEHSEMVPSSVSAAVSEEIVRTNADRDCGTLSFDLSRITDAWKTLQARLTTARLSKEAQEQEAAIALENEQVQGAGSVDMADEEATEALSRVIDKADFASMDVVGQFNLGFIIVRRRKQARTRAGRGDDAESGSGRELDDLFIVDQHAADEKYSFETLQQTTKIDSQKLFHPQVLELTAADELVALENVDVLRQNGFELDICEDRPPGQRVRLSAQPISKGTVFDVKDLEELLHLLQDRPAGQMVRCSKARAMFAMRACRKSVMIGMPLSARQMTSVVRHMGTMDQPWHCPHGRPTMRHLSDIAGVGWDRRRGCAHDVDWTAFGRADL